MRPLLTLSTPALVFVAAAAVLVLAGPCQAASIPARSLFADGAGVTQSSRNAVRITFRQLYFPPARKNAALRALATLTADPESSAPANASNHDVLPSRFDSVTPDYMSELFGKAFAEAVQKLPLRRWGGPVRSGLGWHIVWVDSVSSEQTQASRAVERSLR